MGGFTKLSAASKYGIATAVFSLIQSTFSAAKICSTTPIAADGVTLPWLSISYGILAILYVGFFLLAGVKEIKNGLLYYFGGQGAFTLAYASFSVSFALKLAETAPDWSTHFSMSAGVFFLIATLTLTWKAAPPWGDKTYSPLHTFEDFFLGPPCVWWGCISLLLGSCAFFMNGLLRELGMTAAATGFQQAAILLFIPGRVMFLASAIQSIQSGREFRYGSNSQHIVDVSKGVSLGARLFAVMRQVREAHRPGLSHPSALNADGSKATKPKESTKKANKKNRESGDSDTDGDHSKAAEMSLPGGSWWRKAAKDDQGRYGHIEVVDGQPILHAKLQKDDGTFVEATTPFKELETFTCDDGKFSTGSAIGMTTRELVALCDLYDELDIQGVGYLTVEDLLNFAQALGFEDATRKGIKKMLHDMDVDAGDYTGDALGMTYPEFFTMLTKSLDKGYTCSNEMDLCFQHLSNGSDDGTIRMEQLKSFLDKASLDMDDDSLRKFLEEHGQGDHLTKSDLYSLFGHVENIEEEEQQDSCSSTNEGDSTDSDLEGGRECLGRSPSRRSSSRRNSNKHSREEKRSNQSLSE
mmetsp:Transcript_62249/g.131581  ORF Transcript_62249/g.131581 Transcript_62249/m.131581 type:complete len:582 (+) Transcript_62249:419-2164(+)|eukprot:CAMPEP_0206430414 /NCGR_PEP_ID=MMETSP0324_2-20121206/6802_1 /ASSEMBLY_ACC=CAM_ASM_000836 /TAXON_ID=2866 /ORGANISM="Crypthecodinium cohnii, Strain Seligo" /LENGTH=581 /DNA_ID=CAMNT_0053896241 /DNA_START=370 /DNA_END=2115 /DNA_ORIENTATION=-